MTEFEILDKQVIDVTQKRNEALRQLRKNCKHLRLVEIDYGKLYSDAPPRRICADCGAEEDGWHCGYHVLVMKGDMMRDTLHKEERVFVEIAVDPQRFYSYRKNGPLYLVGQSHPNFAGSGIKTYEQLTEV